MFEIKLNDCGKLQATIEAEGYTGKVLVPALPGRDEVYARSQSTPEPCPLAGIGAALGLPEKVDVSLDELFKQENVFERQALGTVYDELGKALLADLGPATTKAYRFLKNSDMTPEAQQLRAVEALTPALERLPMLVDKVVEPLLERVEVLTAAMEHALKPAPAKSDGAALRAEMRASEIRSQFAALGALDQPGYVLGLAERGQIDALHALDDDPAGRELVTPEVYNRAREVALRAKGGDALLTAWRDSLKLAERAAVSCDVSTGQILGALPLAKRPQWTGVHGKTKAAIAAAVRRARMAPWQE